MLLKICGLKYKDNINALIVLNPAYMGFIFYKQSKRYVGADFDPAELALIPKHIKKVGVFVDEEEAEVLKQVYKYQLDAVQLHGGESPEYCKRINSKIAIIKAFGIDEHFDFKELDSYKPYVDLFLFDTKTALHGGSGLTFNWQQLKAYDKDKPFLLSGGVDMENVEAVMQLKNLNIHALDVNSKFELEPGLKDINALSQLVQKMVDLA